MRRLLPPLVGAAWLWGTAAWLFPGEDLRGLTFAASSNALTGRVPEWAAGAWFVGLLATMVIVDRMWCAWRRWREGDPARIHWSRMVNDEGDFICARCRSVFLLPPEDFDDAKPVRCGDCGAAKAAYGEMKPWLDPEGAVARLNRMAVGGLAGRRNHAP